MRKPLEGVAFSVEIVFRSYKLRKAASYGKLLQYHG
jgi:hypothetical protein